MTNTPGIMFLLTPVAVCRNRRENDGSTSPCRNESESPTGRDSEGSVWDALAHEPTSLWEMIRADFGFLVVVLRSIEMIEAQGVKADQGASIGSVFSPDDLAFLLEGVGHAENICRPLELTQFLGRLPHLRFQLSLSNSCLVATLMAELRVLREALEGDLGERLFLHIPQARAQHYLSPLDIFSASWEKFPSAIPDMKGACRAYACQQYSATLYHCMGVYQCGLFLLARKLGVVSGSMVKYQEWNDLIQKIEKQIGIEVEALRAKKKRTARRSQMLSFYQEANGQFLFFKDSWRNHIAHVRAPADQITAETILARTVAFMAHLASRLSEIPKSSLGSDP